MAQLFFLPGKNLNQTFSQRIKDVNSNHYDENNSVHHQNYTFVNKYFFFFQKENPKRP